MLWRTDSEPFLGGEIGTLGAGVAFHLGAGEGRAALWLAERGWRVTAVDFADVALDRGRDLAAARGLDGAVQWVCADVVGYEPSAAFDLVLMLFLHLAPDDRRVVVRQAAAALAPGGTLVVVGHESSPRGLGPDARTMDPARPFTAAHIVADLDRLLIARADRLVIGDDVDTVVRAVKG